MRIGIDLDNTLICYDHVFHSCAISLGLIVGGWSGNKEQLRDYVRKLPRGEYKWQQLQGYVYAEAIVNAELFSGAFRFLWRAKHRGHKLFIVSHKTKFPHHDPSKKLRVPAINWLKEKGIYDEHHDSLIEKVYFLSTQKEKINKINELNLDVIIDDLKEVVEHPLLKNNINSFHFGSKEFSSWIGIENYLLKGIDQDDCFKLINQLSLGKAISCHPYSNGGNSSVWKVGVENASPLAIKFYYNDLNHSDRRVNEARAIKAMRHNGIDNIPNMVLTDEKIEVSVFYHIDAGVVDVLNEGKLRKVASFIERLNDLKKEFGTDFPLASAACLNGVDIVKQIDNRLLNLQNSCLDNHDLGGFILDRFIPLFKELESWAKCNWPSRLNFNTPLEITKQTLTPSDLGVHNLLEAGNGDIFFIDFEYFGFDDPVKTTSDFLWHPKNKIDSSMGKYWVLLMTNIFAREDHTFSTRLRISWPLYGLCWCLILLNEFSINNWQKKIQFKGCSRKEYGEVKYVQLQKANKLLDFIKLNYQDFPYHS